MLHEIMKELQELFKMLVKYSYFFFDRTFKTPCRKFSEKLMSWRFSGNPISKTYLYENRGSQKHLFSENQVFRNPDFLETRFLETLVFWKPDFYKSDFLETGFIEILVF